MTDSVRLTEAAIDIATDAILGRLAGGTLQIVDQQGTVLAALGFADPAFRPARKGQAMAYALTPDLKARAGGEAWAGIAVTRDGVALLRGLVGLEGSGEAIELSVLTVIAGVAVSFSGPVSFRLNLVA